MKLKVFEAFAGIGSYTIALKKSGYNIDIVGISEQTGEISDQILPFHRCRHTPLTAIIFIHTAA